MWRITELTLRRPRFWCMMHLLLTLPFALALPTLELATDGAALYPRGDPTVRRVEADREHFLEDERVVLLLSSAEPGGITRPEGLRYLRRLHLELDQHPGVRRFGVRSLASLLEPPHDRGSRLGRPYLSEIPGEPAAHADLLARIRAHPLAEGLFVAADGRSAPLYVPVAEPGGRRHLIEDLERWVAAEEEPGYELRLTGPAVAEALLGRSVLRDLARLTPAVAVMVALLLALCLRSAGSVLLVLAEVVVVLVWSLGAMALAGVPVTLVTTILPVVLVAMSVVDEIHLLERFHIHLGAGENVGEAFTASAREVGRPLLLTSLTTSTGFLSLLAAPMEPLRHFGLFAAFGVMAAMLLSFSLIPALGRLLPAGLLAKARPAPAPEGGGLLAWSLAYRGRAFAAAGALTMLLAPGLSRLSVEDAWVENFDPRSDLVRAEVELNRQLWGTYRFDIVCRAEDPASGFFLLPEGLEMIEEIRRVGLTAPHVGGVVSHLRPFELVARAWGWEEPLSRLPRAEVRSMRASLNVVKPRIDLDHYLDAGAGRARIQLLVQSADYRRAREIQAYLEGRLEPLLAGRPASCRPSGDLPVAMAVVGGIVESQLASIAWTLAGVALLLAAAGGGKARALVPMLPIAAAVAWVFAAMGLAGLPLGVASSMFAALAIGVGVDFGLHYIHAYRHGRLASAARALGWNAVVLAGGFSVLGLSALGPNRALGLLLALSVFACYLATLLLLPALLARSESGRTRSRVAAAENP